LKLARDYVLNVQSVKITKKKKKGGFQAFLEKHELMIKPVIYLLSKERRGFS